MKNPKSKRGGKRPGAGRKPTGRAGKSLCVYAPADVLAYLSAAGANPSASATKIVVDEARKKLSTI